MNIVQRIAQVAEVIGTLVAAVAAIVAKGDVSTPSGRYAVVAAIIAAVGHAVTHQTPGAPSV